MGGDLGQAKELAFYPPPTESTKAVGQNVTGFPVEEEKAGFSGGQIAMAESRGGKTRDEVVAIPRPCYVGELARTSQAGWWRRLSLHPPAAICSFTQRLCLFPLLSQQNFCC